ncbi:glycine/betaine ABC transporter permease, partial [Thioclava sp. BHET1]
MATYDFLFDDLGLRAWCNGGTEKGPMSMADLIAQTGGGSSGSGSVWQLPFPSLDALNKACSAIPQSSDLTHGLEQGFLAIRPALRFVVDPLTQPLSWMLRDMIWLMTATPWWIVIPVLLALTWLVSRSWRLLAFVAVVIGLLAFIDHYTAAMQTLAII